MPYKSPRSCTEAVRKNILVNYTDDPSASITQRPETVPQTSAEVTCSPEADRHFLTVADWDAGGVFRRVLAERPMRPHYSARRTLSPSSSLKEAESNSLVYAWQVCANLFQTPNPGGIGGGFGPGLVGPFVLLRASTKSTSESLN